jgi:hypothetical protein
MRGHSRRDMRRGLRLPGGVRVPPRYLRVFRRVDPGGQFSRLPLLPRPGTRVPALWVPFRQEPDVMNRHAALLMGLAAIGIGSACGARSVKIEPGEIDGGAQEDAATSVGASDSAQPAPPASALGGSGDGAITPPMNTGDAILPDQMVDATLPMGTDAGSENCMRWGGGGGGSAQSCTTEYGETCGTTNYQVVCSCPQATCVCFGPTTHVVTFMGCPSCGFPPPADRMTAQAMTAQVLSACGFP